MENITNSEELKKAIQLLEVDQYVIGQQLKEQLFSVYESSKTASIIKNTLKEVISAPFVIDKLIGTGLIMATGYFSNKILLGVSSKISRKLLGSVLQFGVKKCVTHAPKSLKAFAHKILQRRLYKKQSPVQP